MYAQPWVTTRSIQPLRTAVRAELAPPVFLRQLVRHAGRRRSQNGLNGAGSRLLSSLRRLVSQGTLGTAVALCGVDNAEARAALEKAGFNLVVEAGLGAGLASFRNIALHTFPASRSASDIWSKQVGQGNEVLRKAPTYAALGDDGMDECGLVRLASRTIAVPFVGLIAGCLVDSELPRRLHAGVSVEVLSVSTLALNDAELVTVAHAIPYAFGFVETPRSYYCGVFPSPAAAEQNAEAATVAIILPGQQLVLDFDCQGRGVLGRVDRRGNRQC